MSNRNNWRTPEQWLGWPIEMRTYACQHCGQSFKPKAGNHRYCSPGCVEAHHMEQDATRGRYLILERDEFRCIYCGGSSIEHGLILHVDHVTPKDAGGEDTADNLITACAQCNLEKHCHPLPTDILHRVQGVIADRNKRVGIHPKMTVKL